MKSVPSTPAFNGAAPRPLALPPCILTPSPAYPPTPFLISLPQASCSDRAKFGPSLVVTYAALFLEAGTRFLPCASVYSRLPPIICRAFLPHLNGSRTSVGAHLSSQLCNVRCRPDAARQRVERIGTPAGRLCKGSFEQKDGSRSQLTTRGVVWTTRHCVLVPRR